MRKVTNLRMAIVANYYVLFNNINKEIRNCWVSYYQKWKDCRFIEFFVDSWSVGQLFFALRNVNINMITILYLIQYSIIKFMLRYFSFWVLICSFEPQSNVFGTLWHQRWQAVIENVLQVSVQDFILLKDEILVCSWHSRILIIPV